MNILKSTVLVSLITLTFGTFTLAETKGSAAPSAEGRCSELIKECFAFADNARSDCFHAAAGHTFCSGSNLGTLAMKRWSMSPVQNPALESAPAFLGPRLIDGDCVNNFDNKWSGLLVKGDVSSDSIKALNATLDTCNREVSNELSRP